MTQHTSQWASPCWVTLALDRPTFRGSPGVAMRMHSIIAALALASGAAAAFAQAHHGGQHPQSAQPYAGQQTREVASLSAKELDDLLAGRGAGLAKAAELNGHPGPAHVLEFADELRLTPEQRALVQAAFERMQARA